MDRAALLQSAKSAYASGRLGESEALCEQIVSLYPEDTEARMLAGIAAARMGRFGKAIPVLDQVLRQDPEAYEALVWLSIAFRKTGSLKAAAGAAQRAVELRPGAEHALNNLGVCQMALMMLQEAASSFRRATAVSPRSGEAFFNLGTVLLMQGLHPDAEQAYAKAIELAPASADAHIGLGRTYLSQNRYVEASAAARTAVDLSPQSGQARVLLAQALIRLGPTSEAKGHAEKAVELEPENPVARNVLGTVLQSEGRIEEAGTQFRKSITLQPRQGSSYLALAASKQADQSILDQMERLITEGKLPQTEIQALHYGLGQAYENMAQYERAMHHYDEANRIAAFVKFRGEPFDREKHAAEVDSLCRLFTKSLFEKLDGIGLDSDLPILIVGMMRSGTTLMEQILSSHPQVEAAGEQGYWLENGATAFDPTTGEISPVRIAALAQGYLEMLRELAPGAQRVTDKMPSNTNALGLIRLALPNARIIHVVRDPVDTAFSIYATPNDIRFEFAHSKANIAFAMRAHLKLMRHWREVLPPNRFLEVNYEELVSDRECVTRQALEFCGLEWSDSCLYPEKNERTVATPSVWQVRQPVYQSSVQRWRRFEPWLEEFKDLQ